ncbi:MAG: molybdate ABC transporter substrate-binding protein [Aureliella sp.]
MNKMLALLMGSIALLILAFVLLARKDSPAFHGSNSTDGEQIPLLIYCAASNRAVVDDIRNAYEAETGREVQVQYGPSQTLLSSLEVSHSGDLFLPADDSFLKIASDKQLVTEVLPIATMHAVVVVPKGNPKKIARFEDLLRDDVRLVQASPDGAAIGKLTREVLSRNNLWSQLDAATDGYRTTVTDVANDLIVGAADAGIVYDAVLATYPDLRPIELPELASATSQVSVGVLNSSAQPTAALRFARYLTAEDRGLGRYQQFGFHVAQGDHWAEEPELAIFAGSMLRPAIEETIAQFELREGVRVSRNYNGCGILVAQMKSGQHPDAYFACDKEFMKQVVDIFPQSVDVSQNELVILVQKGNPHKIKSLKDLAREGLRVGVGHEKQCAMGWITQNTFKEGGIQTEVMANVTVQTPTGDMLVNQLRSGALDAAVAYLSNAAGSADVLDAVQIQGISCATATQPWGIAQDSRYRHTAARLFDAIASTESQAVFASQGFGWMLPK